MRKTSKLRVLYVYLLLFVTSLTLTSAVALGVADLTVLNPELFSKSVAFTNYDQRSAELARQEAIEIGLLYGVSEEYPSNIDFVSYAKSLAFISYPESVAEKTMEVSISFKQEVSDALQEYALSQGLSLTEEVQFGIDEMTIEVVEAFKAAASIPLHQSFFNLIETFNILLYPVVIILFIILLIQQQILYRLDRHRHFRNLAYVFVTSGWMMILVPLALLINGTYRQIMIYPDYFLDLLIRHFEITLWGSVISGGLLIVIGSIWFAGHLRTSKPML